MLRNIGLSVLLLLFVFSMPSGVNAETASKVVAVVNGVKLSDADLSQELNILIPMNQSFHGKMSDEKLKKMRSDAMKNLIDSELRAQDATSKGIKISQDKINEEMDNLIKRFKSKEALEGAYKSSGFTEKTFKRIMVRRLLAEKMLAVEVDDKVTITSADLKKHYEQNVSKYNKPEEFRASHILIKVDPSSNSEQRLAKRANADDILKRIKGGENFEEIAINESDDSSKIKGGDLGYFHAGQAVPEFDEALSKLKSGELSPVVESLYGYHIIKLTEKRPSRQIPFDEIQERIRADLTATMKKQLLEKWMDGLYKKAKISYPGE